LLASKIAGCECVFQSDTSGGSDRTIGLLICEGLDKGGKVKWLKETKLLVLSVRAKVQADRPVGREGRTYEVV
jgi:hypothetical protein